MSESANCVEQREEQAEVEDAGGAEVRYVKTGIISSQCRVCVSQSPHTGVEL